MTRPLFEIPGRVALVTAASDGIGLACAVAVARLGAQVAIVSRDPAHLAAAATVIQQQSGATPLTLAADLDDPHAPESIVAETARTLGPVLS